VVLGLSAHPHIVFVTGGLLPKRCRSVPCQIELQFSFTQDLFKSRSAADNLLSATLLP
jgi:hypothetical protein